MILIWLAFSCTQSLTGTWTGSCTFNDGTEDLDMLVEAEVWRDNGYVVEGDMRLLDWNDLFFTSALEGDHTGKYVLFKADFQREDSSYQFRVEAERIGSIIEGDCVIRVSDGTGALLGDILLER
jgi:hypothetical protein